MTDTLPMLGLTHGNRGAVTCALKCDSACAHPAPNPSEETTFAVLASRQLKRRSVLIGAGTLGAAAALPSLTVLPAAAAPTAPGLDATGARSGRLKFTPIASIDADVDALTVPRGYTWKSILRWGDPLFDDSPAVDLTTPDAEAQELQFGCNNDYLDIIVTDRAGKKALLCCNREYTNPRSCTRPPRPRRRSARCSRPRWPRTASASSSSSAAAAAARGPTSVAPRRTAASLRTARSTSGPRSRLRPAEDGGRPVRAPRARDDRQLPGRYDPVGDRAVWRGELQQLLRGRPRRPGQRALRADGPIAFDSVGNLWISTDGAPSSIKKADGLFRVPLSGRERGHLVQFLAVPLGVETCGPLIHDRDASVFVAVQHPGEDGTWDAQLSFFPDYVSAGDRPDKGDWRGPRPSVVQVTRR